MNTKDTTSHQSRWGICVVCGGGIEPGRGGRINHHGSTVTLCGSLCLRTFTEEPDAYIDRLAKAIRERKSRRILVRLGDTGAEGDEGVDGSARTSQSVIEQVGAQ